MIKAIINYDLIAKTDRLSDYILKEKKNKKSLNIKYSAGAIVKYEAIYDYI